MATLPDLERLFRHGSLSRRQFIQGLAALGVTAATIEGVMGLTAEADPGQAPTTEADQSPQYLVVIVLDAFRPDYMQLAPMPAVQALQKSGITYDRAWVGQLESETPVGHASLSTGHLPKHDGVIGFEWRDPRTGQEVLDGWPPGVLAGKLEADLKASGAASIPSVVKAAYPKSKVVAISSEKTYAADAMGGPSADYILYHKRSGSTGPLIPTAIPGHEPPQSFYAHPHLQTNFPLKNFTDWDYLSGMLALAALDQFRPKVLMVNFPSGDVYGHPYGGPANPNIFRKIVAGIDRNIARIVQAYKQAGIFDQTLFVITADHGMVPNDRSVDGTKVTKAAVRQAGGQYLFHTGGTAADIYLHNYWHAPAVARQMLQVPNVAAAYFQHDHKGQYQYYPATGMNISAPLDAAYQYLLNTFSGPTAPDVVAPFRENTIGTAYSTAHGDHGGLNWGAQHIPLILSGPGVAQGAVSHFPARLIDVAPTVLNLLNLNVPSMDGVILADAIQGPTAAQVAAQNALSGTLTAYQDALIQQATDNIAEDVKENALPPKSSPARP